MCISPDAHVEARVLQRLLDHGVDPARALAVSRKVRRRYERERIAQRQRFLEGLERARELDDEIVARSKLYGPSERLDRVQGPGDCDY